MTLLDARTSGAKLTPELWRRDHRVRQLASQRGFKIPPPQFINPDATAARAIVNHGRWLAWCPDCIGSAEAVWRPSGPAADGRLLSPFFCMNCGNASAGGVWRWAQFPPDMAAIEARLEALPRERQNWDPWSEEPTAEEEAAWAEAARQMVDPEHGLKGG